MTSAAAKTTLQCESTLPLAGARLQSFCSKNMALEQEGIQILASALYEIRLLLSDYLGSSGEASTPKKSPRFHRAFTLISQHGGTLV